MNYALYKVEEQVLIHSFALGREEVGNPYFLSSVAKPVHLQWVSHLPQSKYEQLSAFMMYFEDTRNKLLMQHPTSGKKLLKFQIWNFKGKKSEMQMNNFISFSNCCLLIESKQVFDNV